MSSIPADHEVMDALTQMSELLFGDGAYELVYKMNPTQSDLGLGKKKKEKLQAQVGLGSNILGMAAGGLGTVEAYNKLKERKQQKSPKPPKAPSDKFKTVRGKLKPVGEHLNAKKSKYAVGLAGAALGIQAANVAGDVVANRVLAREAKKGNKKEFGKRGDKERSATGLPITRGQLVAVAAREGVKGAKAAAPVVQTQTFKAKKKVKEGFAKGIDRQGNEVDLYDVTWEGEFSKFDTDKRQVFGWASVVEVNGEPVVDLQGDYISADEIEKAAYNYVVKSRKGGDMHSRAGEDPLHVSDMIESFMVTPEKIAKMGLPEGSLPIGWWVGYQVNDDATWGLVKAGKRTGFSIHGKGKRAV